MPDSSAVNLLTCNRLCVLSCAIFTFFAQPASSFDLTFAGPTILGQNVSVVWNRNSTDSTAWFLQEISVNNTDPSSPIFVSAPAEPQGVQTILMPSKGPAGYRLLFFSKSGI